jgi:hypothetical protein
MHIYTHTNTDTHTHLSLYCISCRSTTFLLVAQIIWRRIMGGAVVKEQLLWMWQEVAVAYFEIIRTFSWRLTKTTKNLRIIGLCAEIWTWNHRNTIVRLALRNRLQGTFYEAHPHSEHTFYYRHFKARLIWIKVFDYKNIFEYLWVMDDIQFNNVLIK